MDMKIIVQFLALCLFFCSPLAAEEEITPCALINGLPFAQSVNRLPIKDKAKHCTVMCFVTHKCSQYSARALGLTKELIDLLGPGNAERADLEANEYGIQVALANPEITKEMCLEICTEHYPHPFLDYVSADTKE
jgi:hypothetical protein